VSALSDDQYIQATSVAFQALLCRLSDWHCSGNVACLFSSAEVLRSFEVLGKLADHDKLWQEFETLDRPATLWLKDLLNCFDALAAAASLLRRHRRTGTPQSLASIMGIDAL
jgi:hypothetical protein